mmetsp:Transcript_15330/g.23083  ORF Transcript_15330/g.23083 Transcript_15330/m.23083 type:complete len:81 (+) Transcript_15330:1416-1658(+)
MKFPPAGGVAIKLHAGDAPDLTWADVSAEEFHAGYVPATEFPLAGEAATQLSALGAPESSVVDVNAASLHAAGVSDIQEM